MNDYIKDTLPRIFRSPHIENKNALKSTLIQMGCYIGLAIHVLFLYFFWFEGVQLLFFINHFSVAMWVWACWQNYRGYHDQAILIGCTEILVHAFTAVSVLGYGSGFQFYLWPVACLITLSPLLKQLVAGCIALSFIVIFAVLHFYYYEIIPPDNLVSYLPWMYTLNAIIAAVPLLLGVMLVRSITEKQRNKLTNMAIKDELTDLYNRRYLNTFFESQAKLAKRQPSGSFCFALADIDFFKKINDTYGHDEGDRVLKDVAFVFKKSTRESDLVCRWGGEEFVIILMGTHLKDATRIIVDIKNAIFDQVHISQDEEKKVTASFGVVKWDGQESLHELNKRADELLYAAKAAGRNRVLNENFRQTLSQQLTTSAIEPH
ncbi:GGDEF domain-containing protein [Gayadomonas joobiniege]|uniref:GGDEF domain-containing protein n=1 Tax=Gayadomonas joobiniege TaxID=1234606 RepID=UPI00036C0263|nr:GGDEF domain-containing protein [Gayadomonas joobiniege]